MKKTLIIYSFFVTFASFTHAQTYSVDEATAKTAAMSFIRSITSGTHLKRGSELKLVYSASDQKNLKSSFGPSDSKQAPYFYIYNLENNNNYVIVSGDKRALPILGYSKTSTFKPENIPPVVQLWLNGYIDEIQYAIENELEAEKKVIEQWETLLQDKGITNTEVVSPLIKTQWDQSPFYNELCPYNNELGERTAAGCVAVPMAQIMKYWNYPAHGFGSHSYTPKSHPEFGELSVDFENTQYNWAEMPNTISTSNHEIAQLMYHCGVSVDMDYGGATDDQGSVAFMYSDNLNSAYLAFRKYFGYKSTSNYYKKNSYSSYGNSIGWINLIKSELNEGRPVYYGAKEKYMDINTPGHVFIADGYDENDYLHFNWGWGGYLDGFFAVDAIVLGEGTDYSIKQSVIVGIEPLTVNPTVDVQMNSKVSISPSVYIKPSQPFTIKAEFKNKGATTFNGYFCAFIADQENNPYDLVIDTNLISLPYGTSTGELCFSFGDTSTLETKKAPLTEGVYNLAFMGIDNNDGSIKGVISGFDQNCLYDNLIELVISEDASIEADSCEDNNTEDNPFNIEPNFVNDSSRFRIYANIHDTTDIDFYAIKLSSEFEYKIGAGLHDNYFRNNDINSFDGKYSFRQNDGLWGPYIDRFLDGYVFSGETDYLYVKVEPALMGYLGSYSLELKIHRSEKTTSAIEEYSEDLTTIYPVPNNGLFTIKLGNDHLGTNKICITSINGEVISEIEIINPSEITKQINLDVAPGLYLIQIRNNNKNTIRKVIVTK